MPDPQPYVQPIQLPNGGAILRGNDWQRGVRGAHRLPQQRKRTLD